MTLLDPAKEHAPTARTLPAVAALTFGAAALFFTILFFSLYWPYRDLFNEQGRYLDQQSMTVYHEQSGLLVVPALACLALALHFGFVWRARCRSAPGVANGA